jgi:hypothetical protein
MPTPTLTRIWAALRWPLWFVLDRSGRPSTSKLMAFAIYVAFYRGKTIPITVVIALLAAAFGYSAWKDFVGRWSGSPASTDNVNVALTHQHVITETRQAAPSGATAP